MTGTTRSTPADPTPFFSRQRPCDSGHPGAKSGSNRRISLDMLVHIFYVGRDKSMRKQVE